MNWCRRIMFLLNLKDASLKDEEDDLQELSAWEFTEMFRQVTTDMINLQAGLSEHGLSPTLTIHGSHQAEMLLDGECIVGIQVDTASRTLIIYSAQGKQLFDQDEAMNDEYIDEKLYEHAIALLKGKVY